MQMTSAETDLRELQPIAKGVFTWDDRGPRLIGSRCRSCSCVVFPVHASCPRCAGTSTESLLLARRGTLWTWTTQGFRPNTPSYVANDASGAWEPYGVGYVDLGEVRVEGRLTLSDPSRLRVGLPMIVTVIRLGDRATYAFAPEGME